MVQQPCSKALLHHSRSPSHANAHAPRARATHGDSLVERVAEALHLLEPDADDGSLGVAAILEAIAEAGADRNNVLQRTAELNSDGVVDQANVEGRIVERQLEELAVLLVRVSDRRLAEL